MIPYLCLRCCIDRFCITISSLPCDADIKQTGWRRRGGEGRQVGAGLEADGVLFFLFFLLYCTSLKALTALKRDKRKAASEPNWQIVFNPKTLRGLCGPSYRTSQRASSTSNKAPLASLFLPPPLHIHRAARSLRTRFIKKRE